MCWTAASRTWAAFEPHFPRASHSRPAHSSRGSGAHSQLAFRRLRAFPRILRVAYPRIPTH